MRHDELLSAAADPETDRATRRAAFYGLDRLIATLPVSEQLPAGEISALLRVIRDYGQVSNGPSGTDC